MRMMAQLTSTGLPNMTFDCSGFYGMRKMLMTAGKFNSQRGIMTSSTRNIASLTYQG